MITRNVINELKAWLESQSRKPMVIRGARQVGKTYTVRDFAKASRPQFFELNLEIEAEKRLFAEVTDAAQQLKIIEGYFGKAIDPNSSILFIDEIQHSKVAVQMLRYFYEELPALPVIVAGSLLDVVLKEAQVQFPVGRVQYLYMHPVTFDEYLKTFDEKIYQDLSNITLASKIPEPLHSIYMQKVQEYALLGGMPEIVITYMRRKSLVDTEVVFQSLIQGYYDDINKYAKGMAVEHLRHILFSLPFNAGREVIYKGFGGSSYGSREIASAFQRLEDVGLLNRIYSTRSVALPRVNNLRKRPKLIALDTGLVNYSLKQRKIFLGESTLENVYKGAIAEQFIGQTLIDRNIKEVLNPNYWYRDKAGSTAEVDFVIDCQDQLLPIEVKNSNQNILRSLEVFVDESIANSHPCHRALKVSPANLSTREVTTIKGNKFRLVNVPFYLAWRIGDNELH